MVQTKSKKLMVKKRPVSKAELKENEPAYMIQINDPKGLRKDILEGLRESIIFMQGDENFRKIQEEKVDLFAKLKNQVRELNSLVENKLRRILPKGKIKDLPVEIEEMIEPEPKVEVVVPKPKPIPPPKKEIVQPVQKSELEELEDQLKEIENQLRGV